MKRGGVVLMALAAGACRPAIPFRLEAERGIAGRPVRLSIIGDPGARINARLKPALELADGKVLRFDSPHVTGDSAYFTDAPTLEAALPEEARQGLLRASICPTGEKLCRSFELAVRF